MRRYVKLRRLVSEYYAQDCAKIANVLQEREFECSLVQAMKLWELYSTSVCDGWTDLSTLSDQQIWDNIEKYIEIDEE